MSMVRPALLAATLVLGSITLADSANACGNATMAQVDSNVRKLKAANEALEKGDIAAAKKAAKETRVFLSNVELGVEEGKRKEDLRPILRRAIRIEALATSRDPKSTEKDRDESLALFERELFGPARGSHLTKEPLPPPDPTLLVDHAEVLSRIPSRSGQALMVLRTMSQKDLIGSAHAYAALARLEAADGKAEAEKDARERCKKAAVKPEICSA